MSTESKAEAATESTESGGDAVEDLTAPPEMLPLPAWVRRVAALAAVVIGWGFIGWNNHFYFTPAVVILGLGWGASIATLYFLWRVGAAGAVPAQARENWWLAVDQRDELEREKRALLKTIREIEFDQQTGKLSERDAQEMSQVVRLRAIEVMKALDVAEATAEEGGVRIEIERELRARLEVEKARKAGKKVKAKPAAAAKPAEKGAAKAIEKATDKAAEKAKPTDKASRSATAISPSAAADPSEAAPLPAAEEEAGESNATGGESATAAAVAPATSAATESDPAVRDSDDGAEAASDEASDRIATLSSSESEAVPAGSKSSEVSA
jgi:hypothetical protein